MGFSLEAVTVRQESPQLPVYLQNTDFQIITAFSPTLPRYIVSHCCKFALLLYSNTFVVLLN